MRLLLAEDNVLFVKVLEQILGAEHELVVARDGNQAWSVLQRPDAPRLAILDWVMPGMNGPEICRRAKACPSMSTMYLIILTAKNNAADIVSGLRAGADDYVTKPPVPEELRARVTVGQRVLALQDAAAARSVLRTQTSEREECAGSSAGPFGTKALAAENLSGTAAPLNRRPRHAERCARPELAEPTFHPSSRFLENSHS